MTLGAEDGEPDSAPGSRSNESSSQLPVLPRAQAETLIFTAVVRGTRMQLCAQDEVAAALEACCPSHLWEAMV